MRRGRAILLEAILAAPLANFLHPGHRQLNDFQLEVGAQTLVVEANRTREAIQCQLWTGTRCISYSKSGSYSHGWEKRENLLVTDIYAEELSIFFCRIPIK